MKERGITKKELISKSGISSKDYELMKDNKDVSFATLKKICKSFGLKLRDIVNFIFLMRCIALSIYLHLFCN